MRVIGTNVMESIAMCVEQLAAQLPRQWTISRLTEIRQLQRAQHSFWNTTRSPERPEAKASSLIFTASLDNLDKLPGYASKQTHTSHLCKAS